MSDSSWRTALETAKQRLIALPSGVVVRCFLIEESVIGRQAVPPEDISTLVGGLVMLAHGSDLPRSWTLFGGGQSGSTFFGIIKGLGRSLRNQWPLDSSVDRSSLFAGDDAGRWLYILYDIAWAASQGNIPGASLSATKKIYVPFKDTTAFGGSADKHHKGAHIRLDNLSTFLQTNSRFVKALAPIPDPPDWFYSIIDDVVTASIGAIDILLEGADGADSTGTNGAKTQARKKRKTRRRRKQTGLTTKQKALLDFLKAGHTPAQAARHFDRSPGAIAQMRERIRDKAAEIKKQTGRSIDLRKAGSLRDDYGPTGKSGGRTRRQRKGV